MVLEHSEIDIQNGVKEVKLIMSVSQVRTIMMAN